MKRRHFGRMCRCTQCEFPIYVTYANVEPSVPASERQATRFYTAEAVPLIWKKGDRLMEVYEVRELLGEGGMGTVHKVYHRGWGMDLAVKTPKYAASKDEFWLELFEHECETWINLPPFEHVVNCHYVRRLGGVPRVFVEFVPGDDLSSLCKRKVFYNDGKQETQRRILDVLIQFAWGLHHAHERGVMHQDVKPSNVLVTRDNLAKVTDFGLARFLYPDADPVPSRHTPLGIGGPSGGTPVYMAPDGENGYGKGLQADVWSWALSVMQIYAGKVFWQEGKAAAQALELLVNRGGYYTEIPAMPHDLQALLWRCLTLDPEKRPLTMLEIAGELESIYESEMGNAYFRKRPDYQEAGLNQQNNRAVSLVDLGRREEALTLWDSIIESDGTHPEAVYNRELYLWRSGQVSEKNIVKTLYDLSESRTGNWTPRYLLARVLMEQGDFGHALGILNTLQVSRPGDREIAHARAVAKEQEKRELGLRWERVAHSSPITVLAMHPAGAYVATACEEGKIRIWSAAGGEKVETLEGHSDAVLGLCFSSSGILLASCGQDQAIRIWNAKDKTCIAALVGHVRTVNGVIFLNKDRDLLSFAADGSIKLWDVASGRCIETFRGHLNAVLNAALSSNHRYALSGGRDAAVKLWDLQEKTLIRSYSGNGGPVTALAAGQHRPTVVTANGNVINVWNMRDGAVARELHGHTSTVDQLHLFEPSPLLLSASSGTVRLWNLETGQCIRSYKAASPIAISPTGEHLYSGTGNGHLCCHSAGLCEEVVLAPFALSACCKPPPEMAALS
ncbi:MAG: protein kinase [Candidatus Hydrogenedentes bacterium]|nr:protein kinase [Candidatus Hydrogenedentota bacterium]